MKLEHLIQAYKFNRFNITLEEMNNNEEKAGVIKFSENTNASYMLDNEDFVVALKIFSNCIVQEKRLVSNQLKHTIDVLVIIQKTIELLGNVKQAEANNILKQLGLFSGKIEKKAVRMLGYIYEIDVINGILMFSILKEAEK